MSRLCDAPDCRFKVNERKPHVRLNELMFCDLFCLNQYLAQVERFEQATARFGERLHAKRVNWWER